MPFLFMDEAVHQQLNADLRSFLIMITKDPPPAHDTTAAKARRIISTAQGKLIRPGWEETWRDLECVTTAWFGDVVRDEGAAALHRVFTELVRLVADKRSPALHQRFIGQLRVALEDYLALSGTGASRGKKNRRKNINARVIETVASNPDSIEWTLRRWCEYLGCVKATVAETKAWQHILRLRENARRTRRPG